MTFLEVVSRDARRPCQECKAWREENARLRDQNRRLAKALGVELLERSQRPLQTPGILAGFDAEAQSCGR